MQRVGQSLPNTARCNRLGQHCPTLLNVTCWTNFVQHCWMQRFGQTLANIVLHFCIQPVDSPCPTLLHAKCWAIIVQHCSVWHVRSSSKPFWAVLKIGASLKPEYSGKPCKWLLKMLRRNSGVQNWTEEGLFVVEVPTRLPFGRELIARYNGRSFVFSL